ncbi:MAG: UDP-2,3-diacylglucosamine diphosphatase [Rhodobiaceae bacterium]|nr:UDP-2,3-diacylglucosamine diphosphatase [Rhodobiaceae bacterium]
MPQPSHYRTLFLSDIHLGTPDCKAGLLLDFLREHDSDTLYLVGDIIDCWQIRRKGFYWPQSHNDVVQKLLRKARKGTRVVFLPGNHDAEFRDHFGIHLGNVEIRDRVIHEAADGRRLLVVHGDLFDRIGGHGRWLAWVGDRAYGAAMWANKWTNMCRAVLGYDYWPLSRWAKLRVGRAVSFIADYERGLAAEARRSGVDGVVCGHIHHAAAGMRDGIRYLNAGDWVESCTAVAEDHAGRFSIIDWAEITRTRRAEARAAGAAGPVEAA